ncbi:MAG: hypothetical protein NTW65_12705, partial [Deltaproteobacteria bacterium]|nr:hypothetical protein [Deltaproteobacteria bacterium]
MKIKLWFGLLTVMMISMIIFACTGGKDSEVNQSSDSSLTNMKTSQEVSDSNGYVTFTSAQGNPVSYEVMDMNNSPIPNVSASFQQMNNGTLISSFKAQDYLPVFHIGDVNANQAIQKSAVGVAKASSDQVTIINALPIVGFVDKVGSTAQGIIYLEKLGGDNSKWGELKGSTCMTVDHYSVFVSQFLTESDYIGAMIDVGAAFLTDGVSIFIGLTKNFLLNADTDQIDYYLTLFSKTNIIDTYDGKQIIKFTYYVNNNPLFFDATVPITLFQAFHADNTCPNIHQSPLSGIPGSIFNQSGTGFTPNSVAIMKVQNPDGTYININQAIDSQGSFNINYTSDINKPSGTYLWWVEDGVTTTPSNTITYTIITNTTVNPVIAQSPMSGPAGTNFAEWGTGFTPNSTATLHFQKPDGTEYPTASQSIDGNGTFSITYPSPTNK